MSEQKENIVKRSLNSFMKTNLKLEFGDYILFQEYKQDCSGKECNKSVSKPILAIYLGSFLADQTMGFNYVRWNNDKHIVYITNEHVTNYPVEKQVKEIETHIDWSDKIDILGHWKQKPKWQEIIKSYRQQNEKDFFNSDEIE